MTWIVRARKDTSHQFSGIVEQPPGRIECVAPNLWDIDLKLQLELRVDGSLIFELIDDWLVKASQSQPVWFL